MEMIFKNLSEKDQDKNDKKPPPKLKGEDYVIVKADEGHTINKLTKRSPILVYVYTAKTIPTTYGS